MSNANNVSFIISGNGSLTVFIDGKSYSIMSDHKNYKPIIDALKAKDFGRIPNLIDIGTAITDFAKGSLTIKNGCIYYKEAIIRNALTERILAFLDKGLPFEPLLAFLENLMLNPSKRALDELYTFLECNTLPITEDGYFLAYKRIQENWTDFYTGLIDNSIGKKPNMDRNMVDDNKDRTCSQGLHFCSKAYLKDFNAGQGRVIIVKINPKDVVSIPSDYNNTKGRCCEYEVLSEITAEFEKDASTHDFGGPATNSDGTPYSPKKCDCDCEDCRCEEEDYEEEYHEEYEDEYHEDEDPVIGKTDLGITDGVEEDKPVRDEFGRFARSFNNLSKRYSKRDSKGRFV
jgi:hypothetical protein